MEEEEYNNFLETSIYYINYNTLLKKIQLFFSQLATLLFQSTLLFLTTNSLLKHYNFDETFKSVMFKKSLKHLCKAKISVVNIRIWHNVNNNSNI